MCATDGHSNRGRSTKLQQRLPHLPTAKSSEHLRRATRDRGIRGGARRAQPRHQPLDARQPRLDPGLALADDLQRRERRALGTGELGAEEATDGIGHGEALAVTDPMFPDINVALSIYFDP